MNIFDPECPMTHTRRNLLIERREVLGRMLAQNQDGPSAEKDLQSRLEETKQLLAIPPEYVTVIPFYPPSAHPGCANCGFLSAYIRDEDPSRESQTQRCIACNVEWGKTDERGLAIRAVLQRIQAMPLSEADRRREFSQEFVDSFNREQRRMDRHPLTCPEGCGSLVATTGGIVCGKCGYRQA